METDTTFAETDVAVSMLHAESDMGGLTEMASAVADVRPLLQVT
jgi:hypothetical protein